MSDRDERLVEDLVSMRGQIVLVTLTGFEALSVLAQVLWATRQPGNVGPTAVSARRAARKIEEELRLGPELVEVMEEAWVLPGITAASSIAGGEAPSGESTA